MFAPVPTASMRLSVTLLLAPRAVKLLSPSPSSNCDLLTEPPKLTSSAPAEPVYFTLTAEPETFSFCSSAAAAMMISTPFAPPLMELKFMALAPSPRMMLLPFTPALKAPAVMVFELWPKAVMLVLATVSAAPLAFFTVRLFSPSPRSMLELLSEPRMFSTSSPLEPV